MPKRPRKMKVPTPTRPRRQVRQGVSLAGLGADMVFLEPLVPTDVKRGSHTLVRWKLEAMTASGPYTLSTCFPNGRLVQVFDRASAALVRQAEIQEMLVQHAQRAFLTTGRYGDGRRHL